MFSKTNYICSIIISSLSFDSTFDRIVFFLRQSDSSFFLEDKLKESRRQLVPLARILDQAENKVVDTVVGDCMLDVRDITEIDQYSDHPRSR